MHNLNKLFLFLGSWYHPLSLLSDGFRVLVYMASLTPLLNQSGLRSSCTMSKLKACSGDCWKIWSTDEADRIVCESSVKNFFAIAEYEVYFFLLYNLRMIKTLWRQQDRKNWLLQFQDWPEEFSVCTMWTRQREMWCRLENLSPLHFLTGSSTCTSSASNHLMFDWFHRLFFIQHIIWVCA